MFEAMQAELLALDPDIEDAEQIEHIQGLDLLANVIAAVQARFTAAFVASQRAKQIARGVPADRAGRGVANQVGLARRMSPYAARRYVSQVEILTADLPETFATLAAGKVPERRALLVARETSWLSPEHRRQVDREVAPQLSKLGAKRLVGAVKKIAYRLDPHGALARVKIAESERRVTMRPAADGMVRITLLLPMLAGIGAYAKLRKAAKAQVGVGEERRSLDQLMADLSIERLTGHASTDQVPVEVNLIMTDQTLFHYGPGRDEPATVLGGDVIPAELARHTVHDAAKVLLRRLYANPAGTLAAMESRARLFADAQRKFLILRDQTCRTPYCDAPIHHADHITPAETGGATSIDNGQGLCEACNYTKTEQGWTQYRRGNQIITVTPTGHVYRSDDPSLTGRAA